MSVAASSLRLRAWTLNPQIPAGEALAGWAIDAFEQACQKSELARSDAGPGRRLKASGIQFLDSTAIQDLERAQRAPQDTILYQICKAAGVPGDYLDTMFLPCLSSLEGVEVYWHPLAAEPELFASRAYVDKAFIASDDGARLCNAIAFAQNLVRVWVDMLPVPQPVPVQHLARVRECFRSSLAAELEEIERRFRACVDPKALRTGFRLLSELLDSDQSIFLMQGGRLSLRFAGQNGLAIEHELGREFQAGLISILAEKARAHVFELAHRVYLRRFRHDEGQERSIRGMRWQCGSLLRELGLAAPARLAESYAYSEIPLHWWAAASRRIDPWSYPA